MTRERLIRVGNNTLIALERQPQLTLGDVQGRLMTAMNEMGYDKMMKTSEANLGMTSSQIPRWDVLACRELGISSAFDMVLEGGV